MKKVAISIGDLNGIGVEILLKAHKNVSTLCKPIYCVNKVMLKRAVKLLNSYIPKDMELFEVDGEFEIEPGKVSAKSGKYSFKSFLEAIRLAEKKEVVGIVTLPISKEAWNLANIKYHGHTEYLRSYFKKDAIMLFKAKNLYVALFSEHVPLKKVPNMVKSENLERFFLNLNNNFYAKKIAVLGLNPHAGENGILGDEEVEIKSAIDSVNKIIGYKKFYGPFPADSAFNKATRTKFNLFIAMYHDVGLAPLKALYFQECINISIGLPILRVSVDHGTAFDIAYKDKKVSTKSYINAIKYVCDNEISL